MVKCLSIRSTSEGWKRNAVGRAAQSVKYLTCLLWTVSGFFWSHNSAANFHRMRCASCTQHGAALFQEKIEKDGTQRCYHSWAFLRKNWKRNYDKKKKLDSTTVQWNCVIVCGAADIQVHPGQTELKLTSTHDSDSPIKLTCVSLDCGRRPCSEQSPGSFSSEAAGLTAAPAALPL